jgi:hypothetical protein
MEKKPFRILCAVSKLSPSQCNYHCLKLQAEPQSKNDIVKPHLGCVKDVDSSVDSLNNLSTVDMTSKTKRH